MTQLSEFFLKLPTEDGRCFVPSVLRVREIPGKYPYLFRRTNSDILGKNSWNMGYSKTVIIPAIQLQVLTHAKFCNAGVGKKWLGCYEVAFAVGLVS